MYCFSKEMEKLLHSSTSNGTVIIWQWMTEYCYFMKKCLSSLNPAQGWPTRVGRACVSAQSSSGGGAASPGFEHLLDLWYNMWDMNTITYLTWAAVPMASEKGAAFLLEDLLMRENGSLERWAATIIAREGLRNDPLLVTYGIEHHLDPVKLPAGVLIKAYVHMSTMSS